MSIPDPGQGSTETQDNVGQKRILGVIQSNLFLKLLSTTASFSGQYEAELE